MVSFTRNKPEKLVKVALFSGRITHSHPVSDAASIAGAYAVKLALDGVEPGEMYESLLNVTEGISQEFTNALKKSYEIASLWYGRRRCSEGTWGRDGMQMRLLPLRISAFCVIRTIIKKQCKPQ